MYAIPVQTMSAERLLFAVVKKFGLVRNRQMPALQTRIATRDLSSVLIIILAMIKIALALLNKKDPALLRQANVRKVASQMRNVLLGGQSKLVFPVRAGNV